MNSSSFVGLCALVPLLALAFHPSSGDAARSAATAEPARAPADLVTRTYDLSAASPAVHGDEFTMWLAPMLILNDDDDRSSRIDDWRDPDSIAQLVLDLFMEEFQYEGRSLMMVDNGRMRVVAPPALHKEIAAVLGFLEASFRRSVALRIDLIERPAGAPLLPALMSNEEAAALVDGAGPGRSATLSIGAGRIGALDLTRTIALVCDYDVEIAQASAIADPIVRSFPLGAQFVARAAAMKGGVMLAFALQDTRQEGAVRQIEVELGGRITNESGSFRQFDRGTIQTMAVLERAVAMSTFVPDGQAAVIETGMALQAGSSRMALVLRPSVNSKEPLAGMSVALAKTRLEVVDGSSACPPRLWLDGSMNERGRVARGLGNALRYERPYLALTLNAGDTSPVQELLLDDSHEAFGVGPWLIARTRRDDPAAPEPAPWTSAHPAFASQVNMESASIAVTLRRKGNVIAQWSGPALVGEALGIVLAGETLAITDADVEVAQMASVIDPQMSSVFDGVIATLRPSRALDGGWAIEVGVRAHCASGPMQAIDVGTPATMQIMRGEFDELVGDERVLFAAQGAPRKALIGSGGALQLEVEIR